MAQYIYNFIFTSKLANQYGLKALYSLVWYILSKDNYIFATRGYVILFTEGAAQGE